MSYEYKTIKVQGLLNNRDGHATVVMKRRNR